jgi:putative redox protein
MVEIRGRYLGDLRCEAVHGPSGAKMLTDAPTDHEGLGRSFSPTDLVATALGTCVVTILGIVARRRGVDIEGTTFHVAKEMVADPKRRIGGLPMTIRLPASVGEEDRKVLEAAAKACPVHTSLKDVEMPVTFLYE